MPVRAGRIGASGTGGDRTNFSGMIFELNRRFGVPENAVYSLTVVLILMNS
jgi:hypothetical protein